MAIILYTIELATITNKIVLMISGITGEFFTEAQASFGDFKYARGVASNLNDQMLYTSKSITIMSVMIKIKKKV